MLPFRVRHMVASFLFIPHSVLCTWLWLPVSNCLYKFSTLQLHWNTDLEVALRDNYVRFQSLTKNAILRGYQGNWNMKACTAHQNSINTTGVYRSRLARTVTAESAPTPIDCNVAARFCASFSSSLYVSSSSLNTQAILLGYFDTTLENTSWILRGSSKGAYVSFQSDKSSFRTPGLISPLWILVWRGPTPRAV